MAKKKQEIEESDELIEIAEEKKNIKEHFVIEEHDFRMESSRPNDIRFFDLYFMHVVNKGKEKERNEFKIEGYGIPLKSCIRRIVVLRSGDLDKKHYKSFKEFVREYSKQADEVKKLFDILPNTDE